MKDSAPWIQLLIEDPIIFVCALAGKSQFAKLFKNLGSNAMVPSSLHVLTTGLRDDL